MGQYHTPNQVNNRYIGDIKIHNEEFNETYYGFENHQGRTFLAEDEKPLGKVSLWKWEQQRRWGRRGSLQERLWQLLPRSYLVPKCQFGYRLVSTCFKK